MKTEMPTIEYASRPLYYKDKEITTDELAIFGRMVMVAISQGEKVDKEFCKNFIRTKILYYTNPKNVDFSED